MEFCSHALGCSGADPPLPASPDPCADTCLHPALLLARAESKQPPPCPGIAFQAVPSMTVSDAVAVTTTQIHSQDPPGPPAAPGLHRASTAPPPWGSRSFAHGHPPLALVSRTHPAGPAHLAAMTGSRGCPSGAPTASLPAAPLLLHCQHGNGS